MLLRSRRQRPAAAAVSRREERRVAAEARQLRSQQRKPLLGKLDKISVIGPPLHDLARSSHCLPRRISMLPEPSNSRRPAGGNRGCCADIEREAEWIRLHEEIERRAGYP
jgi:hypothetical protein